VTIFVNLESYSETDLSPSFLIRPRRIIVPLLGSKREHCDMIPRLRLQVKFIGLRISEQSNDDGSGAIAPIFYHACKPSRPFF